MKQFIFWISLVVVLFSFTGWFNYLSHNLALLELQLAGMGVSWLWVTALSRLLICVSIGLMGLSLIGGTRNMMISSAAGFAALVIITEGLLASPMGKYYTDHLLTTALYTTWSRILFYFIFILAAGVLLFVYVPVRKRHGIRALLLFFALFVIGFTAMFIIKPIYIDDFTDLSETPLKNAAVQWERISARIDPARPVYLFYLSTGCDHCFVLYQRIAAGAPHKSSPAQVQLVFSGTAEQLSDFTNGQPVAFPYQRIDDKIFYQESGARLPAAYLLENGVNRGYWIGDQFNYIQLDRLIGK